MNNQVFNSKDAEIEIEAFHPGEFLLHEIESKQIQKKDFASEIGVFPNNLSLILMEKEIFRLHLLLK